MTGKTVIQTEQAMVFAATLDEVSLVRYHATLDVLEERGRLESPLAEKIEGQTNLFAIRIMTGGNYRFFYCYDTGTSIFILNGYSKKTQTIPRRELRLALKIRKELGL
ncbi:MAG: type II toxin-antitoxin system RelE/ParE family toxin [Bacteroidaceae bacterium]|nr:type II toxin-antitoxin system RelE/ParE family toxin [Bacteroidaceae bacterium]